MSKTDLIGSIEAADILGINRATFNRWVARGDVLVEVQFPGTTGARLFRRIDVERLAQDRAAKTISHTRRATDIAS